MTPVNASPAPPTPIRPRPIWLRPFMGRLLWAVILLWTLWISRYFLIFFLYALSGDQDPTAIIQLSHISGATFLLPYAMLFSQSGELLFLILLVATLLFFKFGVRKLREAEVPA